MSLEGAIAAHRFGLGARPGEIAAASADPRGWLKAQIGEAEQPKSPDGKPYAGSGQLVADERQQIAQRVAFKNGRPELKDTSPDAVKNFVAPRLQTFTNEMAGRFHLGFTTGRPFAEHLVWFWSNH